LVEKIAKKKMCDGAGKVVYGMIETIAKGKMGELGREAVH
jgi:hypothetical protein